MINADIVNRAMLRDAMQCWYERHIVNDLNAAIAIRAPCELSMIVGPRRRVAASLESRDAFYVKSLLLIILNVTTACNFATNLLAKYRGNIVASNNVAWCMMALIML